MEVLPVAVHPMTHLPAGTAWCCATGTVCSSKEPRGALGEKSTATLTLKCKDCEGEVREPSVADREGYLVWSQQGADIWLGRG